MVETPANNGKINIYLPSENRMQFRLNEISRIKDCFITEICERNNQ